MGKKRRIIHSSSKFATKHATHPAKKAVATTPVLEVAETPIVKVKTPTTTTPKTATKKKTRPWSRK